MEKETKDFLTRIFHNNKTMWWENLCSETPKKKYGPNARFLETTLTEELSDIPEYRNDDRRLFFFSNHRKSSIDGRYGSIGVEEKYNPIDLREHLIDGAIHRGLIWVVGNPMRLKAPEAVSIYVVAKDSSPMPPDLTDLFFPVLTELYKLGIHVVFVSEETGDNWQITSDYSDLPSWLSVKDKPICWDLGLDQMTHLNRKSLAFIEEGNKIEASNKCQIPRIKGVKGEFYCYHIDDHCRAAIMDYGNQWRLIEYGLLLRSYGYNAVKVIYNSQKHKNKKDRDKKLIRAGRSVEDRIENTMLNRFAIKIDWGECD